ncbi:hypothetical protein JOM56_004836 [Amanita muscaria]|uniref:Uncharacterized protein n=1 Tax=Amanita muscaria (strain Koide BX008) TaxID=946122 RepID=A0A0C2SWW9_AMAMK|nr:hypothetical protein M378DRAFT_27434 [Amanita muscaria Koide BX008]
MPSPPICIFLTTIASQASLRQRQDYILRTLQVKKIPFTSYDLASDEEAKRYWKRRAPLDKQQLPGILIGGRFPGTFVEFEDAVEHGELDIFLRLNESWNPADEIHPAPVAKPIGVPGASLPSEMTPGHIKPKILSVQKAPASSTGEKKVAAPAISKSDGVGSELGLQGPGVHVTEKELKDLIKELGLGGDDAGDLVKGLSGSST